MPTSRSAAQISVNSHASPKPGWREWVAASRPKTLAAALAPVLIAWALAYREQRSSAVIAILCASVALALQIVSNFVNDAADFERGSDTPERLGPERMAASGRMTPAQLYFGAKFAIGVALAAGAPLLWLGGWPIVVLGVAAIVSAVAYTAGPFPLSYLGLGDLFVFLFFGLVAVVGCFYLQTNTISLVAWIYAAAIGLHTTAIIVVNNTRDLPLDRANQKFTISVRLGLQGSKLYFSCLMLLPYALLVALAVLLRENFPWLCFAALPLTLKLTVLFWRARGAKEYNRLLALVGLHNLVFVAVNCAAILLAAALRGF